MTKERIREIGGMLRGFAEYAQNSYFNIEVELEEDDYYFDLGQFGESTTRVELKEDKEFDPDEILSEHFPLDSNTILEFAEELEEYEEPEKPDETEEPTLDRVLTLMENDGQGALAKALRAVAEAFQDVVLKASDMAALSLGPLPPKPLPWPGALRPEIDYTAPDFPLRYQPPPGFDWAERGTAGERRSYTSAERVDATPESTGEMILDAAGRVFWGRSNRQDSRDSLTSGSRWVLWHLERDGIPEGGSFSLGYPPRAFDMDGNIIPGAIDGDETMLAESVVWQSVSDAQTVRDRLREIREQFDVNPVASYEPLTVELALSESTVPTRELRLGDDITGDEYGRVVYVERLSNDTCRITMNRDGYINTEEVSPETNWSVLKIVGVNLDREAQPTALSLSGGAPPASGMDYDPLTVPLLPDREVIESNELRLGDDILGATFGRVVRIEDDKILMNRDGRENVTRYKAAFKWEVQKIAVPDRDSLPSAASLASSPVAF